jgi:hypothetical protein
MTAVEWLIDELTDNGIEYLDLAYEIIEQAKELEKQQIIDFGVWYSGMEQEKVKKAFERFKKETK